MGTRVPRLPAACLALVLAFGAACAGPRGRAGSSATEQHPVAHGLGEARRGDEIAVCGRLFHTGTEVVLWYDEGGYDAYATRPTSGAVEPRGLRYQPGRRVPGGEAWRPDGVRDLEELQGLVHQFVLHYDACGTSRTCFQVLQDKRRLSVHFLLDLDGTLYQTLDLQEQAWHASVANPASIGVEIAHIGAYPEQDKAPLDEWYRAEGDTTRLVLPPRLGDGGLRRALPAGPARAAAAHGRVNGTELVQYDFTREQYDALVRLSATLSVLFPRLPPAIPRSAGGAPRQDALAADELAAFEGFLGHQHVSSAKSDPGPAFRWEWFVAALRAELASH